MLNIVFERYDIFLFIYIRMLGFIVFNPVFGRRNIPPTVRGAIALVLAVFALLAIMSDPEVDAMQDVGMNSMLMFGVLIVKEFIFGYLIGLVVNLFFSVITIGGEIMDSQMGLGMSKMYDPASNIQMPLSGNFFNIALMVLFFMTNSHITLVRLLIVSFQLSPVGILFFNPDIGIYLMRMFGEVFILSMKLALPVIAAELISEAGIGILMRAVPQINIFVVGLQLKIIAGVGIMLISAPIAVWFFDGMLTQMNDSIFEALKVLTQ